MTGTGSGSGEHDGRIAVIANTIRETYGDGAIAIAERQIEVAEGESRADWIAILDMLTRS